MFYKCKRCGFICDQKNGLRRHLNRKKQCEPEVEDIDIETLKLELDTKFNKVNTEVNKIKLLVNNPVNNPVNKNNNKDKNILECRYCNKVFSHKQSKYLHESKYCKEKVKTQDELAQLKEQLAEKDEKLAQKDLILEEKLAQKDAEMERLIGYNKEHMDFMKKQIEILMKKAGNNTTNTDNSVNNTDNSINDNKQINININGFGKEDLSYLSDRYFRELFNIPFSAIPTLVEDIHFNPKKPQNWNAKIQDDKTSKALVYNAEKEMWVKREKKEVINEMVEKSYNMLDANFDIQKEAKTLDEKGKRKFENFMKVYDKGDKQLDKRYETEIREKLMNFREYHISKK